MRRSLPTVVVLFTLVLFSSVLLSEEPPADIEKKAGEVLPGHSYHGEAFNEGPRQKSYLMNTTGKISFPVTTKNPMVQKFINQGIGQLHGYWYLESERSFRQAARLDPDCAIAYWGMALAARGTRAKGFMAEAVKRKDKASKREVMYIEALDKYLKTKSTTQKAKDYVKALEAIVKEYPDDLEAKAFYAYAVYRNRTRLKKKYEDVDRALQRVLDKEPYHPIHHFRIHLWDYKDPKKALASSARCGQSAPGIAHMWHMPGHIYSRLKRYEDAVWQQEASARVDHAHMMRDRVLPDQIHNFAHNNEWLIRNLIYIGRHQDAVDLAKNMIELPRHPKYNTMVKRGSTSYGRRHLFTVLYKYEQWKQLIELANGPYLEPTDRESEQIKRLRYLGTAYASTGDLEKGQKVLADLEERLAKKKPVKKPAPPKKGKKPAPKKKPSRSNSTLRTLQQAVNAVKGHLAVARKDYSEGLKLLRQANENRLVQVRVQCLSGDKAGALKAAESYVKSKTNQVHPLACLIELQWLAGKPEDAARSFKNLRAMSGSIQLGAPVFDRLAPIARELALPEDWRVERKTPRDVGNRPKLGDLGPFRWQPSPAPSWVLKDDEGAPYSMKKYQGKPVIVIFYLGFGCLHCAEQIHAFAPKAEKFRDAGIDIIAISTDDAEGLRVSQKNYKGGKKLPFPLVSNDQLNVFKSFRVFDDFENVPLHGTFLIDSRGLVRWQDISYEPFMDVDFLLKESVRLLNQSSAARKAAASR